MKEHRRLAALLLTAGLALAPVAALAEEEKNDKEEKPAAQHNASSEPAPAEGKTVKKAKDPKTQAAEEKSTVRPQGFPDNEDKDEGSH